MKIRLFEALLGYYIFSLHKKDRTRFVDLLLKTHATATPRPDGTFSVTARDKKRVSEAAEAQHISVSVSPLCGLPAFLVAVAKRPGVCVGVLLFCALLFVSSRHVWRVDIEGNDTVPDYVIEENLEALGFGVGTPYRKTDLAALGEEYRARFSHLSYVSVYMQGTVAKVKVRESAVGDETDTEKKQPAFLVADRDAIIRSMSVRHGTPVVSVGQVVKKGDILVSSVASGAHTDTLLAAEGEVVGEFSEVITVEIPLYKEQKTEGKREKTQISVIFFGKTINIFTNSGKMEQRYDTIESEKVWRLPNGTPLPVSLRVTETVLYETEETEIGQAEALRLAQKKMSERISSLVGEGELLGKTQSATLKDGKLTLVSTVRYTANIAVSRPLIQGG